MQNLGKRAAFFVATFFAGHFAIRYFGSFYVNSVEGFRYGNRRRLIAILQLQWLMLYLDLIIYLHIFSIFNTNFSIMKFEDCKISKNSIKKLRFRVLCVYLIEIFFAHLLYILYLFEDFKVSWWLYDLSGIFNGVWLHLSVFSLFFICLNFTLDQLLTRFDSLRRFLNEKLFRWCLALKIFLRAPEFQVLFTLILTFVLCVVHWYSSDKLVVKKLTIPLIDRGIGSNKVENSFRERLKVAVLTDLHAGASVYRQQIEDVVELVNDLDADAIFIIGDAIDAPRFLIEERIEPLRYLNSKMGTFFVTGNHEYYYGNVEDWISLFNNYGITTLRNSKVSLKGICIVGLNDVSGNDSGIPGHRMNVSAISECPLYEPIVVLEHNPAATMQIISFMRNISRPVDLILSGHTHAGQYYIMAPYVVWFLPYFYGVYHLNTPIISNSVSHAAETTLLVSAGTLYQGGPMKMPFMSQIWQLDLMF